jgi:hypothetical protein
MLGVLGSAGAAICLAPSRFTEEWNAGQAINAVTGTRLWAFVNIAIALKFAISLKFPPS